MCIYVKLFGAATQSGIVLFDKVPSDLIFGGRALCAVATSGLNGSNRRSIGPSTRMCVRWRNRRVYQVERLDGGVGAVDRLVRHFGRHLE